MIDLQELLSPFTETYERKLEGIAKNLVLNHNLNVHSWEHTQRVVHYIKAIVPNLVRQNSEPDSEDIRYLKRNAVAAGFFHDVGREIDSCDKGIHAILSEKIFLEKAAPLLEDYDIASIAYAIRYHSDKYSPDGKKPVMQNYYPPAEIDIRVAEALCDADRLDLIRLELYPVILPEFLNTDCAKSFANSPAHKGIYKEIFFSNEYMERFEKEEVEKREALNFSPE